MTEAAGFFNDLDNVADGVEDGKKPAYITKSEIITKKDSTKAWVVTYRVAEGKDKGEEIQEWFNDYPGDADKQANAKKWRKRRIKSFGVPEHMVSQFTPDQAIGLYGIITVKTNGNFQNVTGFVLANEQTGQPITATATPAAVAAPASPAAPATAQDVSSML